MSLRLPPETAASLELLARVEDQSLNQTAVDAIDRMIEARRKDKAFQARLREIIEQDREILDRLGR